MYIYEYNILLFVLQTAKGERFSSETENILGDYLQLSSIIW